MDESLEIKDDIRFKDIYFLTNIFSTYQEFYIVRDDIKEIYQYWLNSDEKSDHYKARCLKNYVYSLKIVKSAKFNEFLQDRIWEYLNGDIGRLDLEIYLYKL